MKRIVKTAILVVAQAAVAWALVTFVVAPRMRGEPLPWQSAAAEGEEKGGEHGEMRELGTLLPMDEILVNVAETKGRRYFKTSVTLEIEGKDLEKQAPERMPILRGTVIDILSSKTMDDLIAPGARDSLKTEILGALNAEVRGGSFRDLWFTEFLVQ